MSARKTWLMLKIIFAAGVFVLAGYSLITKDFSKSSLMMLCLGFMMIATGFEGRGKQHKAFFPIFLLIGSFILFVSLYTWIV